MKPGGANVSRHREKMSKTKGKQDGEREKLMGRKNVLHILLGKFL